VHATDEHPPSAPTPSPPPSGHHAPFRNQVRFSGASTEVPMLAEAAPAQRRAFELIEPPFR
jgi:hypothetical protein